MSNNNFVSANGGNSCSVVSHCQVAGTAGQRFTTAASGWKERDKRISCTPSQRSCITSILVATALAHIEFKVQC